MQSDRFTIRDRASTNPRGTDRARKEVMVSYGRSGASPNGRGREVLLREQGSRKREFLADADGALLTRYPEGLARALEKISADQEPLEVSNRATAHLYFASPFKGEEQKRSWFSKMMMTHPPVEERIAKLRGIENK